MNLLRRAWSSRGTNRRYSSSGPLGFGSIIELLPSPDHPNNDQQRNGRDHREWTQCGVLRGRPLLEARDKTLVAGFVDRLLCRSNPKRHVSEKNLYSMLTIQGLGNPSKEEVQFFQYLDMKEFLWGLENKDPSEERTSSTSDCVLGLDGLQETRDDLLSKEDCIASELSALRVEKGKEIEVSKKDTESFETEQSAATTETIRVGEELLVRLREAERSSLVEEKGKTENLGLKSIVGVVNEGSLLIKRKRADLLLELIKKGFIRDAEEARQIATFQAKNLAFSTEIFKKAIVSDGLEAIDVTDSCIVYNLQSIPIKSNAVDIEEAQQTLVKKKAHDKRPKTTLREGHGDQKPDLQFFFIQDIHINGSDNICTSTDDRFG